MGKNGESSRGKIGENGGKWGKMGENGGKWGGNAEEMGGKGTGCTTQVSLVFPIFPHFPPFFPIFPHFSPFSPIFPCHGYIVGMFVGTVPATGAGYF